MILAQTGLVLFVMELVILGWLHWIKIINDKYVYFSMC